MALRVGSLFSGIGGIDLGFEQAGAEVRWQAEIDPHARAILARRFPGVLCYEDVKDVGYEDPTVDVLVGGFPCQDVSVAGKRAGLAGERSGLWFEFHRILRANRPRWVVIENVPGLLSSNGGRDFGVILDGLVELGYGVTWRVLDAQYFGVAQRRRRLFIVGSLGSGAAAEVLFESEGVRWNPPTRRRPPWEDGQGAAGGAAGDGVPDIAHAVSSRTGASKRADKDTYLVANTLTASAGHHGYSSPRGDGSANLIVEPLIFDEETAQAVTASYAKTSAGAGNNPVPVNLVVEPHIAFAENQRSEIREVEVAGALPALRRGDAKNETLLLAPTLDANHDRKRGSNQRVRSGFAVVHTPELAYTLTARSAKGVGMLDGTNTFIAHPGRVRRLTPLECERLQGFPDGWTDGQADTHRYKQTGNAVAVPVAAWIARRIVEVEARDAVE